MDQGYVILCIKIISNKVNVLQQDHFHDFYSNKLVSLLYRPRSLILQFTGTCTVGVEGEVGSNIKDHTNL